VGASAVRAFEQAGAKVEPVRLGIERDQRELSDLWCRLIMPVNLETFENFKRHGLDLLADHRDDFPPEYVRWIDQGYRISALDLSCDQQVRSEIYDAIQRDRLPVGMQLIGRRYADADVLAASAAFERIRPWQDTYQLCASRPP
jgi:Asp-tRNA(Asn)/Glu-tRNA(Gln) amidotransferase A subunit family amidase